MKEQLELFPIEKDYRVAILTSYLKAQLDFDPSWSPSVRQILEIGEELGVEGRRPLTIIEELRSKYHKKRKFS